MLLAFIVLKTSKWFTVKPLIYLTHLICNIFVLQVLFCVVLFIPCPSLCCIHSTWSHCCPQLWWVIQKEYALSGKGKWIPSLQLSVDNKHARHSRQMGLLHGNFPNSLWWIANIRVLQITARLLWKCLTSDGVLSDVARSASQGHAAEQSGSPQLLLVCHRSLDSFCQIYSKNYGCGYSRCIFSRRGQVGQLTVAMQQ